MEDPHIQKAEHTLQSLDTLKRAHAPDFLWTRIEARLAERYVNPKYIWRLAFSMALILALNVLAVNHTLKKGDKQPTGIRNGSSEYIDDSSYLY